MYLGYQNNKIVFYTDQPLDVNIYNLDKVEETDTHYNLYEGEYITDEELAQKEAERIAKLSLTRGDVFRGLLLAKGVTRTMLRSIIEDLPEETQEQIVAKEMALIDFDEALNYYRGNSLIDTVGEQLGITSEQMDRFFETNDYHELMTEETEGE